MSNSTNGSNGGGSGVLDSENSDGGGTGLSVVSAADAQSSVPSMHTLVKSKPAAPPPTLAGAAGSRPKRPSWRGWADASPVLAMSHATIALPFVHWVIPVSLSTMTALAAGATTAGDFTCGAALTLPPVVSNTTMLSHKARRQTPRPCKTGRVALHDSIAELAKAPATLAEGAVQGLWLAGT